MDAKKKRRDSHMDFALVSRPTLLSSSQTTATVTMTLRVSGMEILGPDASERMCPIEMEDFDKACLDFVPAGTCFVDGCPELCVGTLQECGHRFSPMAIVYHMCMSGMQCPVCRFGCKDALLQYSCVPKHLQRIFQVLVAAMHTLNNNPILYVTSD